MIVVRKLEREIGLIEHCQTYETVGLRSVDGSNYASDPEEIDRDSERALQLESTQTGNGRCQSKKSNRNEEIKQNAP